MMRYVLSFPLLVSVYRSAGAACDGRLLWAGRLDAGTGRFRPLERRY